MTDTIFLWFFVALGVFWVACRLLILFFEAVNWFHARRRRQAPPSPPAAPNDPPPYGSQEWRERVARGDIKY